MKSLRFALVPFCLLFAFLWVLFLPSGNRTTTRQVLVETRLHPEALRPAERRAFLEKAARLRGDLPGGGEGLTGPYEAMLLRFQQTMDPATGTVPVDRLMAANQIARQPARMTQLSPTDVFSERGPSNIGGRVRAVLWDPNVTNQVWAGSVSGGLWKTTDITTDGTSWTPVNDFFENLAISSLAFDPTNTMTFYMGTGEGFFNFDAVRGAGIFKSTDGGANWTQLASTNNSSFHFVQKVVVTGSGTVLAATRDGVQRSTDGGTSWTKVLGAGIGGGTVDRAADLEVAANGDVYAGMGLIFGGEDGVYKSTDDGLTWTKMALGVTGFGRVEVATAPSDANTVYVATQSSADFTVNHILVTTDGGSTWGAVPSLPTTSGQAWYDLILAVDPNSTSVVYLGEVSLFRTTDGGTSWTTFGFSSLHVDHHAIAYRPGSSTDIVFGNDGGVYFTSTGNVAPGMGTAALAPTFVNRNDDLNITQYYGGDLNPTGGSNVMVAGSQDNSTHIFDSPGIDAVVSPFPLNCCDGGFSVIDQTNGNIVIGSIQNGVFYLSTNGGSTFSGTEFLNAGGLFIDPAAYDDAENVFYATRTNNPGNDTDLAVCINMEVSPACAELSISGLGGVSVSTFAPSPYNPGTANVFIGTSAGHLLKISDAAGTPAITDLTGGAFPVANLSSIAIGASENELVATFSNFGVTSVFRTTDGGASWTNVEGDLPDIPVNWALIDPNNTQRVILATDAGLWGTDNVTAGPVAWTREASVPIVRIDQLQYRDADGTVMAITHGRGVWTGAFSTPLPVELVGFTATVDVDGAVALAWQTASERNNAGFGVEHAPDGTEDWTTLAFIAGRGTTRTPGRYAYRAEALPPGTHRFRLKQTDLDGSFTYSQVVEARIEVPGTHVLTPAFPNPFNPQTQFTLTVAREQRVRIVLYDVAGRAVRMLHDGLLAAGTPHRFRIDGTGLSSGTYLYRVLGEGFTESRTVTVLK